LTNNVVYDKLLLHEQY